MASLSAATSDSLGALRREVTRLGRETVTRYVAGSPLYAGRELPEHLYRDSAHTVRVMLDTALRVALGEPVDLPAALADVLERGGERAAEGLPVNEYLRCWQVARVVLDEAVRHRLPAAAPDREAVLADLHDVSDRMIQEAAATYTRYATALAAANTDRDSEMIDRLFAGAQLDSAAVGPAPERPMVVLADIGPGPGETGEPDAEARALAAQRKVRRIRGLIDRELPGVWLMDVRADRARLVVGPGHTDWNVLAAGLNRVAGAPVTLAYVAGESVAELPRTAAVAADVLRTALRMGSGPGAVGIEEMALPLHLTHPSSGLPTLLARCGPFLERPELVETVRGYLDTGMDRRATAEALGVHPNTVDNRLARIRTLTGLDVRTAADLITVAIAVDPALGWSDAPAPRSDQIRRSAGTRYSPDSSEPVGR